jgi:hypothetical protein
MPLIRRKYIIGFIVACIIGFVLPFIFQDSRDSFNIIISSSFVIVGGLASIATLSVALALFDKFGINAKFKDQQIDKVIELARIVSKMRVSVSNGQWNYLYNAKNSINWFEGFPDYLDDKKKTILVSDKYVKQTEVLYNILSNAWLPKEIKTKMDIFKIFAIAPVDQPFDSKYVRLSLNNIESNVWVETIPRLTLEMYIYKP